MTNPHAIDTGPLESDVTHQKILDLELQVAEANANLNKAIHGLRQIAWPELTAFTDGYLYLALGDQAEVKRNIAEHTLAELGVHAPG